MQYNGKNLFPYQNFSTYQTAKCGTGVEQPIWVGLEFDNLIQPRYYQYAPMCSCNGKAQIYNVNKVNSDEDIVKKEYAKAQRQKTMLEILNNEF